MRVPSLSLALFFSFFPVGSSVLTAQQITDAEGDIGIGTSHPHPSALVELASHRKGFLLPRMTTVQRNAVSAPAEGLLIFNSTIGRCQFWDGDADRWETFLTTADSLTGVVSEPSEGDGWLLDGNAGVAAWDGNTGSFVGHADNTNLVLRTGNAAVEFWTGNIKRSLIDAAGAFHPAIDSTYEMGTDKNRWRTFYVSEAGLHIGPGEGESGNRELALNYEEGTGSVNIDGGGTEIEIMEGRTAIHTDLLIDGGVTLQEGHLRSAQAVGPAVGIAGAHVASATLSNGTDIAGLLMITTGLLPAHGAQATVSFHTPYALPPIVTLTPADEIAPGVGAYVTRTAAGFTVGFMGIPAPSVSYRFFYQVIEVQ